MINRVEKLSLLSEMIAFAISDSNIKNLSKLYKISLIYDKKDCKESLYKFSIS